MTIFPKFSRRAGPLVGLLALLLSGAAGAVTYTHKQFIPGMSSPASGETPAPAPAPGYATWNPADKSSNITLSNGNLTASSNSALGMWRSVRATVGKSTGKWYWEIRVDTGRAGGYAALGIADTSPPLNGSFGGVPNYWQLSSGSGTLLSQGYLSAGSRPLVVAGDVFSFLLDADNDVLYLYRNCSQVNGGALVGASLAGTVYPVVSAYASNHPTLTANFGQSAFTCAVPSGYNAGLYN